MANSQQILEIKLDARNRLLKSERRGVTIQIRKDGFTLRAYLPSKSNPESKQTIQQRVPINLKADIKNLDEAHRLAKKLSDEKIGGSFKWENWQKKEEEEVIELRPASKKVGDLIKRYEIDYWNKENKDKNNKSNVSGWKQIEIYLNKMDRHKILTTENIIELGMTAPKGSATRRDIAKNFLSLAKFADIPNMKKLQEWSTAAQRAYTEKAKLIVRDRYPDEEYLKIIKALRDDVDTKRTRKESFLPQQRQWGWALAAQFIFGARTSEIWSIKPFEKDGEILAHILTVEKNKRPTEWRVAGALRQEWAKELNILDVHKEHTINEAIEYDPQFLKSHNRLYTKWIAAKTNRSFQAYDLRHSYGFRTANMNINITTASMWMGHSEKIHRETYMKGYNESDAIQTLKLLRQQQQQQQ